MGTDHVSFELHVTDSATAARRGTLYTPHGAVETPAFMPVGTKATVKGLTIDQILATGSQMILGNTYHLTLRPGEEIISELGGLRTFMGWSGPILTDSGGFQIFSLAQRAKISEQGADFRSHIDGALVQLTPERAVVIQEALGSDVAMQLDHVVALPNKREIVADAMRRSIRWAERSQKAAGRRDQTLFAIVQGGLDRELREESARALIDLDFAGYAIGGLSVGETPEEMYETLDFTTPLLPVERPRYLMGVGRPEDLLVAMSSGVDLFDCVMPTRNGRNGLAFSDTGAIRVRNERYARDDRPLDEHCPCAACRHGRGYLRHLFLVKEMLGQILLSIHNVTYYQRLMNAAREAIQTGRYAEFMHTKLLSWRSAEPDGI